MTTLIYDDLVEDCLEDYDMNFEQRRVTDIDDIDAQIEEPEEHIFEEPVNTSDNNESEIYKSSYRKPSFTLPVNFFDISRNISLLTQCRPIIIKIVDCEIYPWYYERSKFKNNTVIEIKDEPLIERDNDAEFMETLKYNNKKPLNLQSNSSKIKVSREESSLQSHLLGGKDHKNYNDGNIIDCNENEDTLALIPDTYKIVPNCDFNNSITQEYLLKKKAMAQTIVRDIDNVELKCKANKLVNVDETNVITKSGSEYRDSVNVTQMNYSDKGVRRTANEKPVTSPILPCKVRKITGLTKKATTLVESFETCDDSNKRCKQLVSCNDRIIPHFHFRQPASVLTISNFYCKDSHQMMVQHNNIDERPLYRMERNKVINRVRSKPNKEMVNNNYLNGDNNPDPASDIQIRYIPSLHIATPTNIEQRSSNNSLLQNSALPRTSVIYNSRNQQVFENANQNIYSNLHTTSTSDIKHSSSNNSYLRKSFVNPNSDIYSGIRQKVNETFIQNSNLNMHTSTPSGVRLPFSNTSTLRDSFVPQTSGVYSGINHHVNENDVQMTNPNLYNVNDPFRRSNVVHSSNGNHCIPCYSSAPIYLEGHIHSYFPHKSVEPLNQYATSTIAYPMQKMNEGNMQNQNNPLLTQLLNYQSHGSPNHNLSPQHVILNNNFQYQHNIHKSDHINAYNYPTNLYSNLPTTDPGKMLSKLELDVQNKRAFNQEKGKKYIKKLLTPSKDPKSKAPRKSCPKKNSNTYSVTPIINTLTNKKPFGLSSRRNKCSQVIHENFTELKNILNPKHKLEKPGIQHLGRCDIELRKNIMSKTLVPTKGEHKIKQNMYIKETTDQLTSKIKSYSPSILPLPSFEKSLQFLSKLQRNKSSKSPEVGVLNKEKCRNMKIEINQEYRIRTGGENYETVDSSYKEKSVTESRNDVKVCHHDGSPNVDLQDLGYDSDTTVIVV